MPTAITRDEKQRNPPAESYDSLKAAFNSALVEFDKKPTQTNYANLLNSIRAWADARRPKPTWETSNNGKVSVLTLNDKEFARIESKTVYSHLYLRNDRTGRAQLFRSRANAMSTAVDAWLEAQLQVDAPFSDDS